MGSCARYTQIETVKDNDSFWLERGTQGTFYLNQTFPVHQARPHHDQQPFEVPPQLGLQDSSHSESLRARICPWFSQL